MTSVAEFEWKQSLDDGDKTVEITILLDRVDKKIRDVYYDFTPNQLGAHLAIDIMTSNGLAEGLFST
ncbi:MAG: hypothetical protein EX285_05160 [Thaumarchaeota archaeon]|nr:hypothetical protein [Nitrososphaerota archaeon]